MGNQVSKRSTSNTSNTTGSGQQGSGRGARAHGEHAVVLVAGACGNVGYELTRLLAQEYPYLEVRAGVRDTVRGGELFRDLANVRMVQLDADKPETLLSAFTGVNRVFINTPNVENRFSTTMAIADAAKAAGVTHVVYMSMPAVSASYTLFGSQFNEIEGRMRDLGIGTTALRAHMFMENLQLQAQNIKRDSTIYVPFNADAKFAHVAIRDVAQVAAAVLDSPKSWPAKFYTLSGPDTVTAKQLCDWMASLLNRDIRLKQLTWDETQEFMKGLGLQEWYAKGMVEMMRLVDEGRIFSEVSFDTQRITGNRGTPTVQWLREHVELFV